LALAGAAMSDAARPTRANSVALFIFYLLSHSFAVADGVPLFPAPHG